MFNKLYHQFWSILRFCFRKKQRLILKNHNFFILFTLNYVEVDHLINFGDFWDT